MYVFRFQQKRTARKSRLQPKTVRRDEIKHQTLIRRITLHALTVLPRFERIVRDNHSGTISLCVYVRDQPTDLVERVKRLLEMLLHLRRHSAHRWTRTEPLFIRFAFVFLPASIRRRHILTKFMFSLSLNAQTPRECRYARKNHPSAFHSMPVNSTVRAALFPYVFIFININISCKQTEEPGEKWNEKRKKKKNEQDRHVHGQ